MGTNNSRESVVFQLTSNLQTIQKDIDDFNNLLLQINPNLNLNHKLIQLNQRNDDIMGDFKFCLQINTAKMPKMNSFQKKFWNFYKKKLKINFILKQNFDICNFDIKANEMYQLYELFQNYKLALIDRKQQNETSQQNIDLNQNIDEETKEQQSSILKNRQSVWDDLQCQICMYNKIQLCLPCFHVYCVKCYDDWVKVKNQQTCPMCRAELKNISLTYKTLFQIEVDSQDIMNELRLQINNFIKQKNKNKKIFIE